MARKKQITSKDITIAQKYTEWLNLLDAFDEELQKDSTQVSVSKEHAAIAESFGELQKAVAKLTEELQHEHRLLWAKFNS